MGEGISSLVGEGGLEVTTGASAVPSSVEELGTTTFVVRRTGALGAEDTNLPRVSRVLEAIEIFVKRGCRLERGMPVDQTGMGPQQESTVYFKKAGVLSKRCNKCDLCDEE
jgi:hypothetical protein